MIQAQSNCLNYKMSPSSIRAEQNQIHEKKRERGGGWKEFGGIVQR